MPSFFLLLCVLAPATMPTTRPGEWTVVTFNVRNSAARDGQDAWELRKQSVAATIRQFGPDVVGTQEVMPDQLAYLAGQFAGYTSIGVGRDDGKGRGEACQILLRDDRFDVQGGGTFWLSDTPEVVGSVGWDAALTRICTWAKVREKTFGRELFIANTHFDHRGKLARENAAKLLATKLPELAGTRPILLVGDLNSGPDTPAYAALFDKEFRDAFRVAHPTPAANEGTAGGFGGRTDGERIDYVAITRDWDVVACEIDHTTRDNGRFPSDHFAVVARLTLR